MAFFTYYRRDPESWKKRLKWLRSKKRPGRGSRKEMLQALADYQVRLGLGGPSVRNVRLLGEKGTAAVITGQQPGLLTGPLYTIYKTLTVLKLAQKVQEDMGISVVPIFWMASDDHDYDEVASTFLQDRRGEIKRVSLPGRPATLDSLAYLPLPGEARQVVGEMEEILGGSWDSREVSMRLLADLGRSGSLTDWFARIMARLFRESGLIIFDPCLPEAKAEVAPFLQQALLHSSSVTLELEAAEEALRKRGFSPGIEPDRSQSHLFLRHRGHRLGLHWDEEERLVDRGGRLPEPLTVKDVARRMREAPADFSPNAVLRPVVQDHLFPVLAHVAGPGEISYLCQTREVFALFDHQMPIIYPRLSATLVDPQARDLMKEKELSIGDLPDGISDLLIQEMRQLDQLDLEKTFDGLRKHLEEEYRQSLGPLFALDPDLRHLGERNLGRLKDQVSYMERKALQYRRRRHRQMVRSFSALKEGLFPRRRSQETVLNVFSFVGRYGWRVLEELGALPLDSGHLVVYLEGDV